MMRGFRVVESGDHGENEIQCYHVLAKQNVKRTTRENRRTFLVLMLRCHCGLVKR